MAAYEEQDLYVERLQMDAEKPVSHHGEEITITRYRRLHIMSTDTITGFMEKERKNRLAAAKCSRLTSIQNSSLERCYISGAK